MNNRWNLTGYRALVTGGTKGIGHAVAAELLALGAEVMVVARRAEDVARVVADWTAQGLPAFGLAADVTSEAGRAAVFAQVAALWNGLDGLVNNVGTNVRKAFNDYAPAEYERLFHANLFSTMEMCRAAHPLLKASARASIVNIGSVAGRFDVGTGAPYGLTKAAEEQLGRHLAVEWAADGIRVNTVAPWFIRTPLTAGLLGQPEFLAKVEARTPLGRVGEPARQLLKIPELTRRYMRTMFAQPLKRDLLEQVGYGLALEGISATDLKVAGELKAKEAAPAVGKKTGKK